MVKNVFGKNVIEKVFNEINIRYLKKIKTKINFKITIELCHVSKFIEDNILEIISRGFNINFVISINII